jgi:hypothetical protein
VFVTGKLFQPSFYFLFLQVRPSCYNCSGHDGKYQTRLQVFSSDERSSLFATRFSDEVKKSFMALSSAVPLTLPRKSQQQINYKNNKSFSVKVAKPFIRFQSEESLIKLFFATSSPFREISWIVCPLFIIFQICLIGYNTVDPMRKVNFLPANAKD